VQTKWWFTVTIYIYLYMWATESKILTFQMKRKMKDKDGISLMENKREPAALENRGRKIFRVKTLRSNRGLCCS